MIHLEDKTFVPFISSEKIQFRIKEIAEKINEKYKDEEVIFLAVLNGAFMFASDLLKNINLSNEISFIKVSSYAGTNSTGRVDEIIGLNTNLKDKNVIILEDIVDTGITIDKVISLLSTEKPKSIAVASLLYKPSAFQGKNKPDFVGFDIPNKFVVGFGLDYNEKGRNINSIYQIKNSKKNMLNIVLFGPPGSGKGTQSERLIKEYNLIHLSTGDIFRNNIKGNTELGILADSFMKQGQLVPDEVTINMLRSEVLNNPDAEGFIFDGFPRTNAQATALDEFLEGLSSSITVMIALDVEEEELTKRLKNRALTSGRVDDAKPEIIEKRIAVYKKETAPVKTYYEAQDKFVKINGNGEINEITALLFSAIQNFRDSHPVI